MRTFPLTLAALVLSRLGSQTAGFALGVWLYQRTGIVSLNALLALATLLPETLLAPLAGMAVDRFPRHRVLFGGQALATCGALALAGAAWLDSLSPGVAILLVGFTSAARAAEAPAFSASIAQLVPARQLSRANGYVQLGTAIAQVAAPVTGGALLSLSGLPAILAGSVVASGLATALFACLHLPLPVAKTPSPTAGFWSAATLGARWVFARRELTSLLGFVAAMNFALGIAEVGITPTILGFADAEALGVVLSLGGAGLLVGGAAIAITGGPRQRMRGVFWGSVGLGAFLILGSCLPSTRLAGTCIFCAFFCVPMIAASSEAIWQSHVPPEVQGRVFAFRVFAARSALPIAYVSAGLLADRVFEPLLESGGPLAASIGRVMGVGPGRGTALMLCLAGFIVLCCASLAAAPPRARAAAHA